MEIKERQIKLSHGLTHFWEAGQGEPLILLHGVGFFTGGDYWLENIKGLSQHFRVYAPDFVGWGDGDRLHVEYSFSYLADFVREFQDALGISSSHIVGHSMGGWVATVLGYESPDRVRTLTLVGAGGTSTRVIPMMKSFTPPSYDEILQHVRETTCIDNQEETAQRWFKRTLISGAADAYLKIMTHMKQPIHRARYNTLRRLPHIKVPTFIVWGSEDNINELSMGEQMHALIPNSEMAVLPYGHYLPSEAPQEFNAVVTSFIHKHLNYTSA